MTVVRVLSALLLMAGTASAADDPVVVPVWEEPRHRPIVDKAGIRIFSTSIPAGDTSLFHRHEDPTLYVQINGARMRNQELHEEWTDVDPARIGEPGKLLFRDYAKEPQEHRVHNIDEGEPFQVIGVINHGDGSGAPSSSTGLVPADLDNQWFAAYAFKLAAGEQTRSHVHAHPVFLVQVNRGVSQVVERGYPTAEKTVAATWSWHDAGVEHRLNNVGTGDVELIEIEIK